MSKFAKLTAVASICVGCTAWGLAQADEVALTTAQVRAATQAARASGEIAALHGEDSGSFWMSQQQRPAGEPATTAEPDADGLAAALLGEDSGSAYLSARALPRAVTRAHVRAEVVAARDSGELPAFVGEDSGAAFLARQQARSATLYAGPDIGAPENAIDGSAAPV